MLAKSHRLSNEKEILKAQRSKFNSSNQHFKAILLKNKLPNSRFCVIISKKVLKRSNQRHRLKRRILGLIEQVIIPKSVLSKTYDVVFFCNNKQGLHLNPTELNDDLLKLILEAENKSKNYFQKNYQSRSSDNKAGLAHR